MMVVTHEMGLASKVAHRDVFGKPRRDRAQKVPSKSLSR